MELGGTRREYSPVVGVWPPERPLGAYPGSAATSGVTSREVLIPSQLCYVLTAAVTNYHKFSGLIKATPMCYLPVLEAQESKMGLAV